MSGAVQTTDHDEIPHLGRGPRRPSRPGQGHRQGRRRAGPLRIDFDKPEPGLEAIDWDDFFAKFDASGLALLFQDEPDSRFSKLVARNGGRS